MCLCVCQPHLVQEAPEDLSSAALGKRGLWHCLIAAAAAAAAATAAATAAAGLGGGAWHEPRGLKAGRHLAQDLVLTHDERVEPRRDAKQMPGTVLAREQEEPLAELRLGKARPAAQPPQGRPECRFPVPRPKVHLRNARHAPDRVPVWRRCGTTSARELVPTVRHRYPSYPAHFYVQMHSRCGRTLPSKLPHTPPRSGCRC